MSTILNKLKKVLKALFRTTLVISANLYAIPTYLMWMTLLLPVKSCWPYLYNRIERILFRWLTSIVAMWSWTAGYDIVELGDDIAPTRKKNVRTMVIANHQSTADVPLIITCFNAKPNVLPNLMWIMGKMFKYTNFGIVSVLRKDFFISWGRNVRDLSIKKLKKHITDSFIPLERNWIMLFPEGGFLHNMKESGRKYAREKNLPLMEHVSIPRIGAIKAILSVLLPHDSSPNQQRNNNSYKQSINSGTAQQDTCEESVRENRHYLDYVLDITIAYPDGKPLDLLNIVYGIRLPCKTFFLYRLYHTSKLPKTEEAITNWLYERWHEKDKILDDFYKTGSISLPVTMPPTVVQQSVLQLLISNIFLITSSYAHLQVLYMLADYCNRIYVNNFA